MIDEKIRITKVYKVVQTDVSEDPMDEPTEFQLYGWLQARGYSEGEAAKIIDQVDEQNEVNLVLP